MCIRDSSRADRSLRRRGRPCGKTPALRDVYKRQGEGLDFRGNPALLAAAFTSVAATVVSVYLPMVQGFFGTAAVLGADLVPVAIAVLAGPVIMAVLRRVKKLFL